ncbi:MAG: amino acid adenylation domain-containing protein [Bacteroidota bacterium]
MLQKVAPTDKTKQLVLLSTLGIFIQKAYGASDLMVFTPNYQKQKTKTDDPAIVPVRINGTDNASFRKFLPRFTQLFREDIQHSELPLHRMLNLEREEIADLSMVGLQMEELHAETAFDSLPIDLLFSFSIQQGIRLTIKYTSNKFGSDFVEHLAQLYFGLLEQLLVRNSEPLHAIELIPAKEKELIIDVFNDTDAPFPADKTIIDLFSEQCAKQPHAIALQYGDQQLSYADLDAQSNRVANYLMENDCGKGTVVGVYLHRSIDMMVAIFGIQKAGAIYLPLSKDHPADRTAFILENSEAKLVFVETEDAGVSPAHLRKASVADARSSSDVSIANAQAEDVAYIIYTSGSTGQPKGVLIQHRSLVNRLHWMQKSYQIGPKDVLLQKTPTVFDVSVWELFWWSICGARLVLAPPHAEKDPRQICELIDEAGVTTIHFVPSMLRALVWYVCDNKERHHLSSLQRVFASGEALKTEESQLLLDLCPQTRLYNLYGPTEATIDVSAYEVVKNHIPQNIPIGKPIDNTSLFIFNKEGHLQAIGHPGELYIGGVNLAVGYLKRDELTREKFVQHPLNETARLYRTGDLARWLPDGNIEFLGRMDKQVKIRGNRIELGEIESVINSYEGIKSAIVLTKEFNGNLQLVAYLLKEATVDQDDLIAHMSEKLPAYMIPSSFIELENIPLTVNGKVNRKALLAMERVAEESFVPCETKLEKQLANIWTDVLECEQVGAENSFFRMGGDSILALRLLARINSELAIDLSLVDLYEYPSIRSLATYIDQHQRSGPDALQEEVAQELANYSSGYLARKGTAQMEAVYPMSDIEKAMCYGHLARPDDVLYLEQILQPVYYENFSIKRLQRALDLLVQKHETFRTGFDLSEFAHIVYKSVSTQIKVHDLSAFEDVEQRRMITEDLERGRALGFDLEQAPLWRITIYKLADAHQEILFEQHHAIVDGWSFASFLTELNNVYVQLKTEENFVPDGLACGFADAIQQELYQKRNEEVRSFWQKELEGYERLDLHSTAEAKQFHSVRHLYPEKLYAQLEDAAQQQQLSIKTFLHAAYIYALSALSGQSDVLTGLVTFSRPLKEDGEKLLGCFLNTVPFRMQIPEDISWKDYLQLVQNKYLEIKKYEQLSLFEINQLIGGNKEEENPFFDTHFNYVNWHVTGGMVTDKEVDSAVERLDFDVFLRGNTFFDANYNVTLGQVFCMHEYAAPFLTKELFAIYETVFLHALAAMVEAPETKLSDCSLVSEEEKQQLLFAFNDTHTDYPKDKTVLDLLDEQAAAHPDAIALVFEGESISYADLDVRSSQLANHLREQGVEEKTLVPICVGRSLEMVIGILAILKAGAAYIPLDPAYPVQRLSFMMEDSAANFLLTTKAIAPIFDNNSVEHVLYVDQEISGSNLRPQIEMEGEQTAYVIYTSGTTGKPKGVRIKHQNLMNFFAGLDQKFGEPKEVHHWLAVTSMSFDISILELLWTLSKGHRVVIQPDRPVAVEKMNEVDFSLFYFAAQEEIVDGDKYELLLEGAKFGDANGFSSVWVPERHFHSFGDQFPNPSVAAAAVAATTKNIKIRSGSVVLPLHDPVRVAEEWSMVDNLSKGRVELSIASGWNPNDFVLKGTDYKNRHVQVREKLDELRHLWAGGSITRKNGLDKDYTFKIHPRPIQPTLPIWITAASNIQTFEYAASIGANLLTHLLGQTPEELAGKIAHYRAKLEEHGFDSTKRKVALMLHSFVGDDMAEVRKTVEEPFKNYLRHSINLMKPIAEEAGLDIQQDLDAIVELSFNRFFDSSSLFGTSETCLKFVERIATIGVNEIACLIDFGVDAKTSINNFQHLSELKNFVRQKKAQNDYLASRLNRNWSIARNINEQQITHLQSTPSFIQELLVNEEGKQALGQLDALLLGGEALSDHLAQQLYEYLRCPIHNMYGPTETTIWSTIKTVGREEKVNIGKPIANTQIYILDAKHRLCPADMVGEICIGGDGVALGYLNRPELTNEKFIDHPFEAGKKVYRTGDLGRWLPNGELSCLGRVDEQLKIAGHRIEPGEIERVMENSPHIAQSVVAAKEDGSGGKILIAYLIPKGKYDEKTLRMELTNQLPAYMLPRRFMVLDAFPLTPNGKIDRKRLPVPEFFAGDDYVAPSTETEKQLVGVWAEVLNLSEEVIGIEKRFFELGGNSLKVLELKERIHEAFGLEVDVVEFFRKNTVLDFAKFIENEQWLSSDSTTDAETDGEEEFIID